MIVVVGHWIVRRVPRARLLLPFLAATTIAGQRTSAQAAGVAPSTRSADTASLVVQNRTVFVFRAPLGARTAAERAQAAAQRIRMLAETDRRDSVRISASDGRRTRAMPVARRDGPYLGDETLDVECGTETRSSTSSTLSGSRGPSFAARSACAMIPSSRLSSDTTGIRRTCSRSIIDTTALASSSACTVSRCSRVM